MLIPPTTPAPKEWAINLTLNKSSTNSSNFMLLSFSDERPLRYDCTLTTIEEKGKPIAEGTEFTLIPSIVNEDGFATDQIMGNEWIAEKVHVDVGEDDEKVLIKLEEVVLKIFRGKCMCMARIEGTGEVLTTEDCDES